MQPMDFMAETILPPARPTLLAISGGKFCCMTSTVGLGDGVQRVDHVAEGQPAEVRVGQSVHARHCIAHQPAQLRVHAAMEVSVYQFSVHGL